MASRKGGTHEIGGAVFCADAFFPFIDAPEILFREGCRGGIVPAGGRNNDAIRKYFNDNAIKAAFIPSQYRGFWRH